MRVLVIGGRGFANLAFVTAVLDALHKRYTISAVIHGAGPGTDMMTDYWADLNDIPVELFLSDWQKYGQAADAVRNTEMIASKPELVVVFPGGKNTGICKRQAEAARLKVFVPAYRPVTRPVEPEAVVEPNGFDGDSRDLWTKV